MPQLYISDNGDILPLKSSREKYPSVCAINGAVISVRPDSFCGSFKKNPKSTTAFNSLSSWMLLLNTNNYKSSNGKTYNLIS